MLMKYKLLALEKHVTVISDGGSHGAMTKWTHDNEVKMMNPKFDRSVLTMMDQYCQTVCVTLQQSHTVLPLG